MATVSGSIEGRRFVTMRFKRIKTWGHVYHVRRHNTREMDCGHVEAEAPAPLHLVGDGDVSGAIRSVLSRYAVSPRAGEVLALEFIVSASREVFDGLGHEEYMDRINGLISRTLRAFRTRFRIEDQIVSVTLHKDERTPHLHLVIVPLVMEADKRRKDQTPFVRLSAKRVVGGRGDMSREQTRFAALFEDMGLERGKERSGARHVSNRDHEAMLEEARQAALTQREGFVRDRASVERQGAALAADRAQAAKERTEIDQLRAQVEQERADVSRELARLREHQAHLRQIGQAARADRARAAELRAAAVAEESEIARYIDAIAHTARVGTRFRDGLAAMPLAGLSPKVLEALTMFGELREAVAAARSEPGMLEPDDFCREAWLRRTHPKAR